MLNRREALKAAVGGLAAAALPAAPSASTTYSSAPYWHLDQAEEWMEDNEVFSIVFSDGTSQIVSSDVWRQTLIAKHFPLDGDMKFFTNKKHEDLGSPGLL